MSSSSSLQRAVLALLLAMAGCEGTDPSEAPPVEAMEADVEPLDPALLAARPAGSSAEMLGQGRQLYVVCSVCHGLDARGTPLGPSLRDTSWVHISGSVDEIASLIRTGVDNPSEFDIPMPTMGGGDFDEDQLRALATYVYALANGTR